LRDPGLKTLIFSFPISGFAKIVTERCTPNNLPLSEVDAYSYLMFIKANKTKKGGKEYTVMLHGIQPAA
jgi:hypothetical protein